MGVAVGQTKPDAPASYGTVHTGPLHDWRSVHRSIRVDAFDLEFKTGGIDRGPTPTVSVLDGTGQVVKTQRVYPNRPLKTGSLTIYPSTYGLAAAVSIVNTSGVETGALRAARGLLRYGRRWDDSRGIHRNLRSRRATSI